MPKSKNYNYDIEGLIKVFKEHTDLVGDDEEIFNLPKALLEMCERIQSLENELEALSNDYHGYDP